MMDEMDEFAYVLLRNKMQPHVTPVPETLPRSRRGIQKSVLNRTPGHQRDHSSRAQLFFCIVRIIVFDCKGLLLLDSGLESLVTCENNAKIQHYYQEETLT